MIDLSIGDLMFEVTRKCNMKCEHCLRGDAQNVNLNKDIDNFFNNGVFKIDYIKRIIISGGEPTLNSECVVNIIDKLIKNNIKFDYFRLITNGSYYSKRIVDALNTLYKYWLCNTNISRREFSLICSSDQFHKRLNNDVIKKYSALPYFVFNENILGNDDIIMIGNAYKNKFGSITSYYDLLFFYDFCLRNDCVKIYRNDNRLYIKELYISAKGKYGFHIIDSTYDMVDELCKWDLDDIYDNINSNNEKVKDYTKKRYFFEK